MATLADALVLPASHTSDLTAHAASIGEDHLNEFVRYRADHRADVAYLRQRQRS